MIHDTSSQKLSTFLSAVAEKLPEGDLTLRELLEQIGEKGMLVFCILLILPFLIPVSIPGLSTVFGLLITLIGIGISLNQLPWLPERLMQKVISKAFVLITLEKAAKWLSWLDKISVPRLLAMSESRFNGAMLTLGGILLLFPFGFVPFSNTLPGIAVLLLAVGMLQKDGYLVLAGYAMNALTIVYFAVLFVIIFWLGGELWTSVS